MEFSSNGDRKLTFLADEGYQMMIMELIGKDEIKSYDFNILMKGLLLNAHTKSEGIHVIVNRNLKMVCIDRSY